MQKVYLKISGVERPHAIIGNYLYEDERFYVINDNGIKRKALWANILYIEDIGDLTVNESIPDKAVEVLPIAEKKEESLVDISVFFTGFKEQTFKLTGISKSLLASESWTPELAKTIFTNSQIKAFMGDFVVDGMSITGDNIYIKTASAKKETPQPKISADSVEKLQQGASMLGKIFKATEVQGAKFPKPTGNYPTSFNMTASPFESPISLKDEPIVEGED